MPKWSRFVPLLLLCHSLAFAQELPRTVFVHLFEWTWNDIAHECEEVLGPKGFSAVQVSPPNEHVLIENDEVFHPWYQRYQPVSYELESRSGSSEEFEDMVARCAEVGVDIYVDAIINHMAGVLPEGESGEGYAGSEYLRYEFPGLYQPEDFHHCNRHGDDDIRNYQDQWEIQNCELVNLADLNTGSDYVRETLAWYLDELALIGVKGVRIDAAKHIHTDDIRAILDLMEEELYVYQEVIDHGGEPIKAEHYFKNGDVTEFLYGLDVSSFFRTEELSWLQEIGPERRMMPTENAIVFIDNHDNQRGHGGGGGVLTHKEKALYTLANVFMLAWPYGYPRVMSSYEFEDPSEGPPSDDQGNTLPIYEDEVDFCGDGWVCEHRWKPIANMVMFRNVTNENFYVTNWWDESHNQIAFGRGELGFVVINGEDEFLRRRFETSLQLGTYCDIISGELDPDTGKCTGHSIEVEEDGTAMITVFSKNAVALHVEQVVGE